MKLGDGAPISRELGACPDLSPKPGTRANLLASLESLHFQHGWDWLRLSWRTVFCGKLCCTQSYPTLHPHGL